MIAAFALPAIAAHGQTKDSPLRLYEGGPDPKIIKRVIPHYPRSAQSGSMVLELTLRPDGKVDAVTVIRPLRGATDAAIAALKRWEYEPILFKGKPAWAIIDVLIWNPCGVRGRRLRSSCRFGLDRQRDRIRHVK